jgi:hypothetical protein
MAGRFVSPDRRFALAGEKPTAGFVLGLIGGILMLLEGLLFVVVASMASSIGGLVGMPINFGGLFMALAAIGLIFALIVLLSSVMLYMRPASHVLWGVMLLLFSIFSFVIGGGFYLGGILGLIGGILGIVFKPAAPMAAPYAPPMAPPPQ